MTILVLDTENKNVYTDSRSYSEWVYQPTKKVCSITDDNTKKCWKVKGYCIAVSGQSSYSYENFIDCFLKYGYKIKSENIKEFYEESDGTYIEGFICGKGEERIFTLENNTDKNTWFFESVLLEQKVKDINKNIFLIGSGKVHYRKGNSLSVEDSLKEVLSKDLYSGGEVKKYFYG